MKPQHFWVIVSAMLISQSLHAVDAPTTRPAQTPVLSERTLLKPDVFYGGPDAKMNVLDLYAPTGVHDAPIIIFVHGGEWSRGDKHDVSSKPKFFNDQGIIFVAVNYRLSPANPHPAQVDDVARSIAWVHRHANEWGGSPEKIVIMGHSAGCHVVSYIALNPEPLAKVGMKPSDLKGAVAWSGGMYDLVARANGEGMYPPFIKATFGDNAAGQKAGSPMSYVGNAKDAPPFLFASVDDAKSQTSREATNQMVKRIKDNGGRADNIILVGKSHFTANHELGGPGDYTGKQLMTFFDSVIK